MNIYEYWIVHILLMEWSGASMNSIFHFLDFALIYVHTYIQFSQQTFLLRKSAWPSNRSHPEITSLFGLHVEIARYLGWLSSPQNPTRLHMWSHIAIVLIISCYSIPHDTLWWTNIAMENGPVEIVDFPIKNGESFHGKMLVHQRVSPNFVVSNLLFYSQIAIPSQKASAPRPRSTARTASRRCAWSLEGRASPFGAKVLAGSAAEAVMRIALLMVIFYGNVKDKVSFYRW